MIISISKAYDDFIKTKEYISYSDKKNMPDYLDDEEMKGMEGGYFYLNQGCYILKSNNRHSPNKIHHAKKDYSLIIERSEYYSDSLIELENILFSEFAMNEYQLLYKENK